MEGVASENTKTQIYHVIQQPHFLVSYREKKSKVAYLVILKFIAT